MTRSLATRSVSDVAMTFVPVCAALNFLAEIERMAPMREVLGLLDRVGGDVDRREHESARGFGELDAKTVRLQAVESHRGVLAVIFEGAPWEVGDRGAGENAFDLGGQQLLVEAPDRRGGGIHRHHPTMRGA